MTSERAQQANRRNARASTGPRTPTGKARARQNAHKHGLAATDPRPDLTADVESLAASIADELPTDAAVQQAAKVLAEAELGLRRVRTVKLELTRQHIAALEAQAGGSVLPSGENTLAIAAGLAPLLQELERLARYERRAFSRRKSALLQLTGLARASAHLAPIWPNMARQGIHFDANGGS